MPGDQVLPALTGIRVVDASQIGAGPFCASLLADLGADVIKVEPPGGDPMRDTDEVFGVGESSYFVAMNRSKRCLALDLTHPDAGQVLDRVLGTADVLLTSMRPASARRLGLDYAALRERHPRLVVCSITAFGETGPYADVPGMDILAQAAGGVMGLTGAADGPPTKAGPAIADFTVSFIAAWGISTALLARERDGHGQQVAVNLLDGQVAMLAAMMTGFARTGTPVGRWGNAHPHLVPYQLFATADGHLVVGCINDKLWQRLCAAVGLAELGADPRFAKNADRRAHRDEVVGRLTELFATDATAAWLKKLHDGAVPAAPVNELPDLADDPQVAHNGMLLEVEHPRHGSYLAVNSPLRLSGSPAVPPVPPPGLGEHTDQVLTELGYSVADVAALRSAGVLS